MGSLDAGDNSGAKLLHAISVVKGGCRLNRLARSSVGDMVLCTVRKGGSSLQGGVVRCVVIRQRRALRRSDGRYLYFPGNSAVCVSQRGEMQGTLILGPVSQEASDVWPSISAGTTAVL